jgi:hypothetical protein
LRKRLSYSKVYVEISATGLLVKEYDLHCPKGNCITISADYEWIPFKCSYCKVFGHSTPMCFNNKTEHPTMMIEAKRNNDVVRTIASISKPNQFQWQQLCKRNKSSKFSDNDA